MTRASVTATQRHSTVTRSQRVVVVLTMGKIF